MAIDQVKKEISDIIKYLFEFYKHPSQSIKKVPHWSWLSLFVLIFIFASITGVLRGLFSASLLKSIVGFIFLPISAYISIFLVASLLYFLIVVFQNRNLNFKRLTTLVFITLIPTLTMYVVSLIHPLITIIGITASFILLSLGLYNRFQLNKKFIQIVLTISYFILIGSWLIQYTNINPMSQKNETLIEMNLKSQKILEQEMSN